MRLLQEPEDLYRAAFEHAGEGIYLMMPQGEYVKGNKALARIFGYASPDDVLATLSERKQEIYVDPGLREKVVGLVQRGVINSGFESRVRKKDGSMIWISESVGGIRNKKGEMIGYRWTVRDITDRRKVESELRESEQYYRRQFERDGKCKSMLLDIIDEIHGSYQDLEELHMNVVVAIMAAVDDRRPWQRGHSERVATYSLRIAKKIGLDEGQMRDLRLAALLHDIGHMTVPDELVSRPAKLTREEFEPIKRHPCEGAAMLSGVKQLAHIIPVIRHHHERFDGSGYPDGLKGNEIPLGARILHLADSYDSMTAERPYRPTPGRAYALQQFETCSNAQFDPDISKVALAVL
jgi:PAS domain S-box-containing protein/putative nucleotidyltransferase with HDIG domain